MLSGLLRGGRIPTSFASITEEDEKSAEDSSSSTGHVPPSVTSCEPAAESAAGTSQSSSATTFVPPPMLFQYSEGLGGEAGERSPFGARRGLLSSSMQENVDTPRLPDTDEDVRSVSPSASEGITLQQIVEAIRAERQALSERLSVEVREMLMDAEERLRGQVQATQDALASSSGSSGVGAVMDKLKAVELRLDSCVATRCQDLAAELQVERDERLAREHDLRTEFSQKLMAEAEARAAGLAEVRVESRRPSKASKASEAAEVTPNFGSHSFRGGSTSLGCPDSSAEPEGSFAASSALVAELEVRLRQAQESLRSVTADLAAEQEVRASGIAVLHSELARHCREAEARADSRLQDLFEEKLHGQVVAPAEVTRLRARMEETERQFKALLDKTNQDLSERQSLLDEAIEALEASVRQEVDALAQNHEAQVEKNMADMASLHSQVSRQRAHAEGLEQEISVREQLSAALCSELRDLEEKLKQDVAGVHTQLDVLSDGLHNEREVRSSGLADVATEFARKVQDTEDRMEQRILFFRESMAEGDDGMQKRLDKHVQETSARFLQAEEVSSQLQVEFREELRSVGAPLRPELDQLTQRCDRLAYDIRAEREARLAGITDFHEDVKAAHEELKARMAQERELAKKEAEQLEQMASDISTEQEARRQDAEVAKVAVEKLTAELCKEIQARGTIAEQLQELMKRSSAFANNVANVEQRLQSVHQTHEETQKHRGILIENFSASEEKMHRVVKEHGDSLSKSFAALEEKLQRRVEQVHKAVTAVEAHLEEAVEAHAHTLQQHQRGLDDERKNREAAHERLQAELSDDFLVMMEREVGKFENLSQEVQELARTAKHAAATVLTEQEVRSAALAAHRTELAETRTQLGRKVEELSREVAASSEKTDQVAADAEEWKSALDRMVEFEDTFQDFFQEAVKELKADFAKQLLEVTSVLEHSQAAQRSASMDLAGKLASSTEAVEARLQAAEEGMQRHSSRYEEMKANLQAHMKDTAKRHADIGDAHLQLGNELHEMVRAGEGRVGEALQAGAEAVTDIRNALEQKLAEQQAASEKQLAQARREASVQEAREREALAVKLQEAIESACGQSEEVQKDLSSRLKKLEASEVLSVKSIEALKTEVSKELMDVAQAVEQCQAAITDGNRHKEKAAADVQKIIAEVDEKHRKVEENHKSSREEINQALAGVRSCVEAHVKDTRQRHADIGDAHLQLGAELHEMVRAAEVRLGDALKEAKQTAEADQEDGRAAIAEVLEACNAKCHEVAEELQAERDFRATVVGKLQGQLSTQLQYMDGRLEQQSTIYKELFDQSANIREHMAAQIREAQDMLESRHQEAMKEVQEVESRGNAHRLAMCASLMQEVTSLQQTTEARFQEASATHDALKRSLNQACTKFQDHHETHSTGMRDLQLELRVAVEKSGEHASSKVADLRESLRSELQEAQRETLRGHGEALRSMKETFGKQVEEMSQIRDLVKKDREDLMHRITDRLKGQLWQDLSRELAKESEGREQLALKFQEHVSAAESRLHTQLWQDLSRELVEERDQRAGSLTDLRADVAQERSESDRRTEQMFITVRETMHERLASLQDAMKASTTALEAVTTRCEDLEGLHMSLKTNVEREVPGLERRLVETVEILGGRCEDFDCRLQATQDKQQVAYAEMQHAVKSETEATTKHVLSQLANMEEAVRATGEVVTQLQDLPRNQHFKQFKCEMLRLLSETESHVQKQQGVAKESLAQELHAAEMRLQSQLWQEISRELMEEREARLGSLADLRGEMAKDRSEVDRHAEQLHMSLRESVHEKLATLQDSMKTDQNSLEDVANCCRELSSQFLEDQESRGHMVAGQIRAALTEYQERLISDITEMVSATEGRLRQEFARVCSGLEDKIATGEAGRSSLLNEVRGELTRRLGGANDSLAVDLPQQQGHGAQSQGATTGLSTSDLPPGSGVSSLYTQGMGGRELEEDKCAREAAIGDIRAEVNRRFHDFSSEDGLVAHGNRFDPASRLEHVRVRSRAAAIDRAVVNSRLTRDTHPAKTDRLRAALGRLQNDRDKLSRERVQSCGIAPWPADAQSTDCEVASSRSGISMPMSSVSDARSPSRTTRTWRVP